MCVVLMYTCVQVHALIKVHAKKDVGCPVLLLTQKTKQQGLTT